MGLIEKYTPGRKLEDAVKLAKELEKKNIATFISFLPVKQCSQEGINSDVKEYRRILDTIHKENLDTEITLKLHQFGFYGNKDMMKTAVTEIIEHAEKLKLFVWIDVELSDSVQGTVDLFIDLNKRYKNIGICLQSYLKRTEEDMKLLLKKRVPFRLVKGFYKQHDFKDWKDVTRNYEKLMEYLLFNSNHPCIATHDKQLIETALKIVEENKIKNVEFEFFNGVCNDYAYGLAKKGYKVRIYLPYGNLFRYLITGIWTFDNWRNIKRYLGVKNMH